MGKYSNLSYWIQRAKKLWTRENWEDMEKQAFSYALKLIDKGLSDEYQSKIGPLLTHKIDIEYYEYWLTVQYINAIKGTLLINKENTTD